MKVEKCKECGAKTSIYKNNKYFECFLCGYWTTDSFDIYDARKMTGVYLRNNIYLQENKNK